jgi:anti-sigma B factor antagonist
MSVLSFVVESEGAVPRLALTGDLDIDSAPRLKEALSALRDAGATGFELDLTRLVFIDSTGLGTLVAVWNSLGSPEGGVRLVGPSPAVARAFAITGLAEVFPTVADPR